MTVLRVLSHFLLIFEVFELILRIHMALSPVLHRKTRESGLKAVSTCVFKAIFKVRLLMNYVLGPSKGPFEAFLAMFLSF